MIEEVYSRAWFMEKERKVIAEFEGSINTEVRWQEKLNMVKKRDFRRGKLSGKYTVKMLYKWDNGKFENKYSKKLERN